MPKPWKTVRQEWASYREMVVAADASPQQVEDLRCAFFSGAWAVTELIMRQLSPAEGVTPEDEELMTLLMAELEEFRRQQLIKATVAAGHRRDS